MKINNILRLAGLLALVLTVAVGCASSPESKATGPTATQAQAAIAAAKDAYKRAVSAQAAWKNTGGLIKKAEALEVKGNYAGAIKLANKARRQAEDALTQHAQQMAKLKPMIDTTAATNAKAGDYTVVRGDSLWRISGKDTLYGNPYEWPLIYKANQDKIKQGPDLIFPGQVFNIRHDASQAEINTAVHYAKTRGKWALGVVESADKAYLAQ